MKEIVESYFQQRSLVNHQLASYNDCIPSTDGKLSRMEKIVRNIRIGTDDPVEDDDGGISSFIASRLLSSSLGASGGFDKNTGALMDKNPFK